MKLHVLEIQAFGPFAKKAVIHFSALGDNALFLIDGPTGAGKSSILHAICYALYGETTDSDRKELGLRCDHAEADLLTELSLEFSIRDDRYRITRVPTQMRPSKRGGGETEHKSTAHLRRILQGGEEETLVAKKNRDADDRIKDIVGLSSAQFLQVMVLPQGKFRALLLAKSDDRQTILSTLFQTEIYQRIEQLLKDKAGAIDKQNQSFEERKTEAFADVGLTESAALEKAIEDAVHLLEAGKKDKELAADKKQQAAIVLETAEALGQTFARRNSKQQEWEAYRQKADEIKADKSRIVKAELAASITPTWQTLQAVLQDVKDKQAAIINAHSDKEKSGCRVNKAKVAVNAATESYQQRDTLKAEESKISGYRDKLAVYQAFKATALRAGEHHERAIAKKTALQQQDKAIEQALISLHKELEALAQATVIKADIVEQKLKAKGRYDQRLELAAARTELEVVNQAYQQQKAQYESADACFKQLEKEANRIEMRWFSNQAAVLAAKLEAHQPCAVCGSLEHPDPAHFAADAADINQAAVEQARQAQANQFKVMNANKESMMGCLHAVTNKQKDINALATALGDEAGKSVLETEQVYKGLEQDLKTIEAKEIQLLKAKQDLRDQEQARLPIAQQMQVLEGQLPELTAAKATAETELESANTALPEEYRSSEVIAQVLAKIEKKIKALETQHQNAHKELMDALTQQSSLEATVTALHKSLADLESRQQVQAQLWQQALVESEFATQQVFANAQMGKEALRVLQQDVKVYDTAVTTLQAELGLLEQQLSAKQPPDVAKLQQQLNALSHAFTLAEGLWTTASQQHKKLIDTQNKVQQIEQQQLAIKKQYEIVGTLAKAASGRGNVRVSLERFVLGNILDQVLSIASERLHIMSKGQYRLIRQNEQQQKRNTTAGLDLAIDDAYTGKTRPVATLSGGESFMASLALALGLSDVVQERSGGIQLDTLFIDEGFGSLDQDSLQLAVNTLIDLQSTGRTIGIISHVSELKEQMSQRIEVTGSCTGSTIKVVA